MATKPTKISKEILVNGIKSDDLENIKKWAEYLAQGNKDEEKVSSSQIRKFHGKLKSIQADYNNKHTEIIILDANLAYAVGKAKNKESKLKLKAFYELLSPLILEIKGAEDEDKDKDKAKFKILVQLVEALVAYHKYYGGK